MTPNEVLELIVSAEREAGELMLHAHGIIAECKTSAKDVVTEYDRRVQLLLEERIRASMPEARFFCEEMDERDDLNGEAVFIIDPIDGTMNFVRGFNHSCVAVAYRSRGTVLAAAVYNPYVDELFTAVRGQGAKLNGSPIHADGAPLSDCLVCCGTVPYLPELTDQTFAIMRRCFLHALDIRRQGTAELDLCSVAAGRAGLFVELSLSLWDYAAGALIVTEAGGVCLTESGGELPYTGEKSSVLAGGRQAAEDYLRSVRP